MQSGEMLATKTQPVQLSSTPIKDACSLPPLKTDASVPETSEDDGDESSSSRLSDWAVPSDSGTDLTDAKCSRDEHDASEPDADTTSLCVDTQDYLVICERAFPNPKYGWSWCAVDDESLVMSDKRLDFRYLQDNFHLYQAPIEPTRVLDLKAASGYWADKVALVNGSATVLGIDIAPVQYATEPNCYFEFHNVNWEWARAPGSFDLIRGSKLLGNVKDWPSLFRSAYKCLMPGGFLELYDPLFSYLSASDDGELSWKSVSRQACELGKKTSCSFAIAPGMYTRHMVRAGFVDIQEKWESADVTKYELHDVESMLRLLWYLEGVDDQEIWARLGDWRSRLTSEADSVRVRQVAVLGRKPFDGEITLASEG